MKKIKTLILLIFLLIPSIHGYVKPIDLTAESIASKRIPVKADFRIAFKRLLRYEGNYANNRHDYGRETYQGISRRFNPKWTGWQFIDQEKSKTFVYPNQKFGGIIDFYAQDYYLDIWVKEGFDRINSQKVANYFLDFRVHSSCVGINITRKLLYSMGYKVDTKSYIVDDELIDALNKVNPNKFINALKLKRIQLFDNIVWKDTSQKVFYYNWVARAKDVV